MEQLFNALSVTIKSKFHHLSLLSGLCIAFTFKNKNISMDEYACGDNIPHVFLAKGMSVAQEKKDKT